MTIEVLIKVHTSLKYKKIELELHILGNGPYMRNVCPVGGDKDLFSRVISMKNEYNIVN